MPFDPFHHERLKSPLSFNTPQTPTRSSSPTSKDPPLPYTYYALPPKFTMSFYQPNPNTGSQGQQLPTLASLQPPTPTLAANPSFAISKPFTGPVTRPNPNPTRNPNADYGSDTEDDEETNAALLASQVFDDPPFSPITITINTPLTISGLHNSLNFSPLDHAKMIGENMLEALRKSSMSSYGIPMIDENGRPRPVNITVDAALQIEGEWNVIGDPSLRNGKGEVQNVGETKGVVEDEQDDKIARQAYQELKDLRERRKRSSNPGASQDVAMDSSASGGNAIGSFGAFGSFGGSKRARNASMEDASGRGAGNKRSKVSRPSSTRSKPKAQWDGGIFVKRKEKDDKVKKPE